jgi:hypothetical protein
MTLSRRSTSNVCGDLKPRRPTPSVTIRYYIDADLLGLGKVLANVRSDVTYPGDPGSDGSGKRATAASLPHPSWR